MEPIIYCICRGVQNWPGFRISHIIKAIPTTLDKIPEINKRELEPLYSQNIYDIHTLIIDWPADISFLQKFAEMEG